VTTITKKTRALTLLKAVLLLLDLGFKCLDSAKVKGFSLFGVGLPTFVPRSDRGFNLGRPIFQLPLSISQLPLELGKLLFRGEGRTC
jgi:hypothetical protein